MIRFRVYQVLLKDTGYGRAGSVHHIEDFTASLRLNRDGSTYRNMWYCPPTLGYVMAEYRYAVRAMKRYGVECKYVIAHYRGTTVTYHEIEEGAR